MRILYSLSCLRYCKSTIFQANHNVYEFFFVPYSVVCDTAKVRFFKQITTSTNWLRFRYRLFAILQKYDFSSKSQHLSQRHMFTARCLRYCKSTIFQANHNQNARRWKANWLFAILQKYDFSSKSQHIQYTIIKKISCLRYCKSTIFQANHNSSLLTSSSVNVVCDTAKVRFFKQITT